MAVFDVSFANKKTAKSSGKDYGYLVDRLDILESSLEADGKLGPGDYDILRAEAQRIYGFPGLSDPQRSNIQVKMARYSSLKSRDTVKDQNDIAMLNRELEDDLKKMSMGVGNNPKAYLETNVRLQEARISRLTDAINNLDASGDDVSAHMNEFNTALVDYQDSLAALEASSAMTPGSIPQSGFAAYVITNNQGEITDVKVKREGSVTGYLETNGLYGGLKIYGKLNRKENGQNVFLLGADTYSGSDFISIGPDGSVKPSPLLSSKTTGGKNFGAVRTVGSYVEMDPVTTKTQSAIRSGGWVEGEKGFLYQKGEDGRYTKYVNASREQLNIGDTDIIRVPRSFESSITPMVSKTIDGVPPPEIPMPASTSMLPGLGGAPTTAATTGKPMLPGLGGGPPPQPTARAATGITGIAAGAAKSAMGYLGRLFGR